MPITSCPRPSESPGQESTRWVGSCRHSDEDWAAVHQHMEQGHHQRTVVRQRESPGCSAPAPNAGTPQHPQRRTRCAMGMQGRCCPGFSPDRIAAQTRQRRLTNSLPVGCVRRRLEDAEFDRVRGPAAGGVARVEALGETVHEGEVERVVASRSASGRESPTLTDDGVPARARRRRHHVMSVLIERV